MLKLHSSILQLIQSKQMESRDYTYITRIHSCIHDIHPSFKCSL